MNLAELDAELSKDPAYVQAGRELKPVLDLADDVLRLRLMGKKSLIDVSYLSDLPAKFVRRIESGLADAKVSQLNRLAYALDATLEIRLVPNEEGE